MPDPRTVRVLFVDDNPNIRSSMSLVFEAIEGMQLVGLAENTAAALGLCEKVHPDIVLIDLGLPGRSGISIIRQIKKHYPGIEIVVMTGFDDQAITRQAVHAGAGVFLSKDTSIDELVRVLRQVSTLTVDC